MQFKIKSQLDHIEKGGVLDDCGPATVSALIAWASKYEFDPSAADGIKAKFAVTKQKDVDGKADNGSTLAQLIQTARHMGAQARYAKSWDDVVASAKAGAAIGVWVEQPSFYPNIEISAWHEKWKRWWWVKQKQPNRTYGHMTGASWCQDHGWQWGCPTRSGKGKEAYAVLVTEAQLRQIADSKRASGKHKAPEFKHCIIVTWKTAAKAAPAPAPAPVPVRAPAPVPAPAREAKVAPKPTAKKISQVEAAARQVDWVAVGARALDAASGALSATSAQRGIMAKIIAALKHIAKTTQVDELLTDGIRTFATVTLSTALALGVPLLEVDGPNWKLAISAGLSSAAVIIIKALDPKFTGYGVTGKDK